MLCHTQNMERRRILLISANRSIVCYVTHKTWKEGEYCLYRRIIYSEGGGSMVLENFVCI